MVFFCDKLWSEINWSWMMRVEWQGREGQNRSQQTLRRSGKAVATSGTHRRHPKDLACVPQQHITKCSCPPLRSPLIFQETHSQASYHVVTLTISTANMPHPQSSQPQKQDEQNVDVQNHRSTGRQSSRISLPSRRRREVVIHQHDPRHPQTAESSKDQVSR